MLRPLASQVAPLASVFRPPPSHLGAWLPVFRGRVTMLQGSLPHLGDALFYLRVLAFHL